jgi:molybdenum cofactor cytidylyltransferase
MTPQRLPDKLIAMNTENRAHPVYAQPVVLVLASGAGERFAASGGTVHKLRAALGEKTVLDHTLAAVRASGLPWHLEDGGHPGMGDSIASAVRATAKAPGWLVLPGDLPLVLPETLRTIAAALAEPGCAVAMPVHQGERGHPVGFAAACLPGLLALKGPHGAATVVRQQAQQGRVRSLVVDDLGTVTDVDTVKDLERAALMLAARQ